MVREHNVPNWSEILSIAISQPEIYFVLRSKGTFMRNLLLNFIRNTAVGKKVKEICAKGDMVPPELTIDLLLKAIKANCGKYKV